MNDSLAPLDCSTTSSSDDCSTTSSSDAGFIAQEISTILTDTITLNSNMSSNTNAIGGGHNYYYSNGPTMTITSSGNVGIGTTGTYNTIGPMWAISEEFVDVFPDFNRVQKMCKEYPGLAIAFEKFKTTYKLVKDHYDTPEDQRPLP
jgi:hypothetical protein